MENTGEMLEMTITQVIAIVGILVGLLETICMFLLAYVINKLEKISDKLGDYVTTATCDHKMCQHYEEIQNLWQSVRENSEDIAELRGGQQVARSNRH